jgi:hypothetical protein
VCQPNLASSLDPRQTICPEKMPSLTYDDVNSVPGPWLQRFMTCTPYVVPSSSLAELHCLCLNICMVCEIGGIAWSFCVLRGNGYAIPFDKLSTFPFRCLAMLIPITVGHAQIDGKARKCIFLAGHESIITSSHTGWTEKFTFWAHDEPLPNMKKISLWFVDESADGQSRWKIREEHGSDSEQGWIHQTNLYVPESKQPGHTHFKVFSASSPAPPKHHRFLISPTSSDGEGVLKG